MPDIELHQLERPYGELRIASPARQRRLLASLAVEGQQSPVLVVEAATPPRAHRRLPARHGAGGAKASTVSAIVLPLGEAEARCSGIGRRARIGARRWRRRG